VKALSAASAEEIATTQGVGPRLAETIVSALHSAAKSGAAKSGAAKSGAAKGSAVAEGGARGKQGSGGNGL
jgi:Holliday junction resolvasome RuvABC DNA-binding subunit